MKKITLLGLVCTLLFFPACKNKVKPANDNLKRGVFPAELVNFVPFKGNPVFKGSGTNSWDQRIRERGFILFEDNLYKMWYTGYNPVITNQKYLGYATSPDGINWTKYSEKPIFDEKWTEDMFVVKNCGTYYMYAEGENDVAHFLVSGDGIQWHERGNLIIKSEKGDSIPGPYGTPTVWIENGKWYLFYERKDAGIWLATSEDKIHWKNIQDEPVIKPGPGKYDIGAVAADQVIKYKGNYYLYYHSTSSLDWEKPVVPVLWTSSLAMSEDLEHWIKFQGNPIVQSDNSSPIVVFTGNKPLLYTMHPEVCLYIPR